jgi:hypothetical protein
VCRQPVRSLAVEVLHVKQLHGHPASIGTPADRSSTWRRFTAGLDHCRLSRARVDPPRPGRSIDARPGACTCIHSTGRRGRDRRRGPSSLFCLGPSQGGPGSGSAAGFRATFFDAG